MNIGGSLDDSVSGLKEEILKCMKYNLLEDTVLISAFHNHIVVSLLIKFNIEMPITNNNITLTFDLKNKCTM
jgi:hypothetical protein